MPIAIRHDAGRLAFTCTGRLGFDDILAALKDAYARPGCGGGVKEWWDLSACEGVVLKPDYITRLGEFEGLQAGIHGKPRCAVYAPDPVLFGMARMYQMVWTRSPLTIRAFRDRAEAEAWLAG